MKEKKMTTNLVAMTGKIADGFAYSYDCNGENYYRGDLVVQRRSLAEDRIPLVVPEKMLDANRDYTGDYVSVQGQFQSRNYRDEERIHTSLSVFASNLDLVEEKTPQDRIYLEGFVCRPPVYRRTPGGKEITEMILAVNRPTGRTDYIPCITWGRTARFASHFPVGEHLLIWGRIQSREYTKHTEEESRRCVTYEVSVARLEIY